MKPKTFDKNNLLIPMQSLINSPLGYKGKQISPVRSILKKRIQNLDLQDKDIFKIVRQDPFFSPQKRVSINKDNENLFKNDSKSPSFSMINNQFSQILGSDSRSGRLKQALELDEVKDRSLNVISRKTKKTNSDKKVKTPRSKLNGTWQKSGLIIIYYISRFIMQLKTHATQMKEKFLTKRMLALIGDNSCDSQEIMRIKKLNKQQHRPKFQKFQKFQKFFQNRIHEISNIYALIPLIEPDSQFKIVWNILVVIFIIMNVCYTPMELSFSFGNSYCWIFDTLPSWAFIVDIILNFNTAYYKNGVIHHNKKEIFFHYVSGDFWLDLLIVMPFILIQFQIPYVRYTSLLRMVRVKQMVQSVEDILNLPENVQAMWDLCKSVYFIIFVAHLCACAWHYIGLIQVSVYNQEESWLLYQKIYDAPWTTRYVYSFYFSTITTVTVGYGDITPVTLPERIFVIIVTLIICGVFGYTISNIGEIFKSLQEKQQYYKSRIKFVNQYLKKKKLNKQLQLQVRKYFEYCFKIEAEREGEADILMSQLTKNLKEKVQIDLFYEILLKSRLVRETLDDKGIVKLCNFVKEKKFAPEAEIFSVGDIANKLIYLKQGQINLFTDNQSQDQSKVKRVFLKQLKSDVFLTECEFATNSKYIYSGEADKFTSIVYFNYEDYLKILKEDQQSMEKYSMLRDNIIYDENYKKFGQICEICQWTHIFTKCPFTFFQANKNKIANDFKKNNFQERIEFKDRSSSKTSSYSLLRRTQETVLAFLVKNELLEFEVLDEQYLEQLGFILDDDGTNSSGTSSKIDARKKSEESCIVVSDEKNPTVTIDNFKIKLNTNFTDQPLQVHTSPKNNVRYSYHHQDSSETLNRQGSSPKKISRQYIPDTQKKSTIINKDNLEIFGSENIVLSQKFIGRRRSTVQKNQIEFFNQTMRNIKEANSILKSDLTQSIQVIKFNQHPPILSKKTMTDTQDEGYLYQENLALDGCTESLQIDKQFIMKFYFSNQNFDIVIKKVQEQQNKINQKECKQSSIPKLPFINPLSKIKHKSQLL